MQVKTVGMRAARTERIQCCNCCDLAVDVDQLGGTPLWQAWLWCTVGTIVWVVWMRMLKRMQDRASADYNVKNVTCADFSVWVSNLPSDADKDSELRKFAEHYGEVVAAFHIRRMGNVLNLNNRLEDAELHLAETKALSDSSGGFLNTLYRMYVCGFSSADSAAEKLEVLFFPSSCATMFPANTCANILAPDSLFCIQLDALHLRNPPGNSCTSHVLYI